MKAKDPKDRPQHGDTKGAWESHDHDYAAFDEWGAAMKDAGPVPDEPDDQWGDVDWSGFNG